MKITSMDIVNKEFKKVIRGYSIDEVDEFLAKIAEDYESLYKENSSLKEKYDLQTEKLEHYSKMEATIQNTLLLAQNAAEQSKENAQKEAEMIIKNANESAQKILDKAHADVMKINDDYERLKQEFIKFRAKFKNFMNTQIEMINTLEKDLMKNYNIGSTSEDSLKEKDIDMEEDLYFKVKDIMDDNIIEEDLSEIKNFFVKGD